MYYLSRVEINNKNAKEIKELNHLGTYHNWVEQMFPENIENGVRPRHLWRIDILNGVKYLLVLSEEKPDLDILESHGIKGTGIIKEYDKLLDTIKPDSVLKFRLTANPVRQFNGKAYPHVTVKQQRKWLLDRAEANGFTLDDNYFTIVSRDYVPLKRKNSRGCNLSRVSFEGILKVTDVDSFKDILVNGLGREKAFGMGLMTVVPF
ncbi:type I-E CRISPR-associated protein Cas6/Cse3/CasE [Ligilactobacillus equi]|uniref:Type I-E CRISPR-associated protein Cas6/Cse3/CasE n=1 Tax=Ligilactobacillus equi DPC 6820 TaxID=1392007 RepID=V7HV19_9LACO|nr:type I-E CRISPR-associated protein Cas6/Cse3/CasE [Ligilactobacillus equi]ETA73742.1 hypothetical protein LEQ_0045c [Ligilactobacillus equi DPC 6820]